MKTAAEATTRFQMAPGDTTVGSRPMSEPEPTRRIEVFTGAGRRRAWSADQKAAIVADSFVRGRERLRRSAAAWFDATAAFHLASSGAQT